MGAMKMNEIYRSQYEACPSLCDQPDDLRCDLEILMDELASLTGLLRAELKDTTLQGELLWVCELSFHLSSALRGSISATKDELLQLEKMVHRLQGETSHRSTLFVLTQGSKSGALSHVLRTKCKALVRLLYRHSYQGHSVDPLLFDFTNLLSGYFFFLALKLNELDGVDEIEYISRHYNGNGGQS
jgi:cob(I)alamin adenosyltransferase